MSKNKKVMFMAGFALVALIALLNIGSDKIV